MSMITLTYRIYLHNFLCLRADVLPGKVGEEFCCVTALVGGSQGAQQGFSPRAISLQSEVVSFIDMSPQNCVSRVSKRTSEPVACRVIYSVNSVCLALDETSEGRKTVPPKELKKTVGRQEQ